MTETGAPARNRKNEYRACAAAGQKTEPMIRPVKMVMTTAAGESRGGFRVFWRPGLRRPEPSALADWYMESAAGRKREEMTENSLIQNREDGLKEECGVFGMYDF